MTKTLTTKESHGWTTDDGQVVLPHTLYRFVDENGEGGCWYASLDKAEISWERWVASAPARARRKAENARHRAAITAANARRASDDPFAIFD